MIYYIFLLAIIYFFDFFNTFCQFDIFYIFSQIKVLIVIVSLLTSSSFLLKIAIKRLIFWANQGII